MKVQFQFKWYDLWIGAYWDRIERILYICPIPCCVIKIWKPLAECQHDMQGTSKLRVCRKCGAVGIGSVE